MGSGVIPWAFPFSMDRVEFGLYGAKDGPAMMAGAAVVILVVELGTLLRGRRVAK